MLIVNILIYVLLLFVAGRQKAIMDLILEGRLDYKGYAYTRAAMEATKDADKDGKITYWESTFPKDAWHRAERYRVLVTTSILPVIILTIGYFFIHKLEMYIVASLIIIVIGWTAFNVAFLYYHEGTREGKKLI